MRLRYAAEIARIAIMDEFSSIAVLRREQQTGIVRFIGEGAWRDGREEKNAERSAQTREGGETDMQYALTLNAF